ncbi:MAG: hypothetical protein LUE27_07730 [Clostridia bacterium]|nr:hypothetical protein [Clostridia bacterium]
MKHCIIMASAYSLGCRIGYDMPGDGMLGRTCAVMESIREDCWEDVPVSLHCLSAEGDSPEDVVKADPYFANVLFLPDLYDFIHFIRKNRELSCLDVAAYIMSVMPEITEADLLWDIFQAHHRCWKAYGIRLYADVPVPLSRIDLYGKCRRIIGAGGTDMPAEGKSVAPVPEMSFRSRILASENGETKLKCINECLKMSP